MEAKKVQPAQAPSVVVAAKVEPPRSQTTLKRRPYRSTDDLCRQLMAIPEIDLDSIPGTSERLLVWSRLRGPSSHVLPELFAWRSDLAGLPLQMGLDCRLGKESTENLQVLSRKLRSHLIEVVPKDGVDMRHDAQALRRKLLDGKDGARQEWVQAEALPTLVQMLQVEEKPVRLLLVDIVSKIKGRSAAAVLARLALFDLSEEVRDAAVDALRQRPSPDYRDLVLAGFRYPWAPVADHAAETLVSLGDREAIPQLVNLLSQPDPNAPVPPSRREDRSFVREMVRVNHLRNCLLCHAPSFMPVEPVRGLVPTPGLPLPPPTTPYYDGNPTGTFVRADITYLRPDFSVSQPVAEPGAWPTNQRYDYLIRNRPFTSADSSRYVAGPAYPQREAVLFALKELTGKDLGPSTEDWQAIDKKRKS
jgi:hypothetical protein